MIRYHDLYRDFLVALDELDINSVGCYIGYLESTSLWLGRDITPKLIRNDGAVDKIREKLSEMGIKDSYIRNYRSAMRRYLEMARNHNFHESQPPDTPPTFKPESRNRGGQSVSKMSRGKARRRAEESEIPVATAMCYAKITWQGSKQVWWFDLPVDKTEGKGKVTLLLYDQRIDKLHCLQVPKNYFGKNLNPEKTSDDRFKFRPHLSTDGLFCNKRKKCGGDISFKKFPRREC